MNRVLLLLTEPPSSLLAWHGVELAQALIQQNTPVDVFFYQDAACIANRLNWRPVDEPCLAKQWQALPIKKPVCVSAALARGITDRDNAIRHDLLAENIADGFHLVGLGELADLMLQASRVIHL
jgi:tRNA 2-thiouridine synthesizing protein D